jgi:hypothetical protein
MMVETIKHSFSMNSLPMTLEALWLELARAKVDAGEFDVFPWESQNVEVQRVWREVTDPSRLKALEEFSLSSAGLNAAAQEAARQALRACLDACARSDGR